MLHQIEITTRCNFSCFYCAGRDMPQRDMAWEAYVAIVDAIAEPRATVSLQGEGEPSLHPRFWDMAAHAAARGHLPYTILNGSRVDSARLARHFAQVAVSIDTLDAEVAERIGRHNLPKVLDNLAKLTQAMGPRRIVIMTVDLGQPLDELRAWARDAGYAQHIVQPLQPKADYAQRYPVRPPRPLASGPRTCDFVQHDRMRFYSLDGLTLPCCFIKDTRGIASIDGLKAQFAAGEVPMGCQGCLHLRVAHPSAPAAQPSAGPPQAG